MLTVEERIDIAKAYLEYKNQEAGPSYINNYNSNNEELEI